MPQTCIAKAMLGLLPHSLVSAADVITAGSICDTVVVVVAAAAAVVVVAPTFAFLVICRVCDR
jgi:hypothetical protein